MRNLAAIILIGLCCLLPKAKNGVNARQWLQDFVYKVEGVTPQLKAEVEENMKPRTAEQIAERDRQLREIEAAINAARPTK